MPAHDDIPLNFETLCAWCDATDGPMSVVPDGLGRLACVECVKAGKVRTEDGKLVVLEETPA